MTTLPRNKNGLLILPKVPCYKNPEYLCRIREEPDIKFECCEEPESCRWKQKGNVE